MHVCRQACTLTVASCLLNHASTSSSNGMSSVGPAQMSTKYVLCIYFVYIVQYKLALCIPSLTLQSDCMIDVCVCVALLKLLSDCDACESVVVVSAHKHSEHS